MALWGKKSSAQGPAPRLKQQLSQVVRQSARLEVHRLDDEAVDDDFGNCRAQDYLEDRHQLVVDHPTRDGQPLEVAVGDRVRAYLELNSAMLYFALKRPAAARVYLEAVVTEYPDTVWARAALLEKARSFAAEGSTALAENEYQRLIELYPGTEEARTAAAEKTAL